MWCALVVVVVVVSVVVYLVKRFAVVAAVNTFRVAASIYRDFQSGNPKSGRYPVRVIVRGNVF
jgi:predicted alpha/beta hydrolase